VYLIIIDYSSDAERKRIDYAIERWKNNVTITKPKGTIITIDGDNKKIDEFIEDISARVKNPEKKVKINKIINYVPNVEKNTKKISFSSKEPKEYVERFIDYLMSKLNASYEYNNDIGKVYKIYTKKGQARLDIALIDKMDTLNIDFYIDGYGNVVDFISDKIDNEMNLFLRGR